MSDDIQCPKCKRHFPRVYSKCPYCKSKNPAKAASAPKPKCYCLELVGDNPNCPIHGAKP